MEEESEGRGRHYTVVEECSFARLCQRWNTWSIYCFIINSVGVRGRGAESEHE